MSRRRPTRKGASIAIAAVASAQTSAAALDGRLEIVGWVADPQTAEPMARVGSFDSHGTLAPALPLHTWTCGENVSDTASPWLLPAIRERLAEGVDAVALELRPVVAFFCRFEGFDYDGDQHAPDRLDAYLRHVQRVLSDYGGAFLQLGQRSGRCSGSHLTAAGRGPSLFS